MSLVSEVPTGAANKKRPSAALDAMNPRTSKNHSSSITTSTAADPYNSRGPKPGWAYVPDTGQFIDPSKAPLIPASGPRKRATRNVSGSGAAGDFDDSGGVGAGAAGKERDRDGLSARQRTKIAQHLNSLDRENHRDVVIAVPAKAKDLAGRSIHPDRPMTPAVKKILASQKTFANHLADEEAAIANQQQPWRYQDPPVHASAGGGTGAVGKAKVESGAARSSLGGAKGTPAPASGKKGAAMERQTPASGGRSRRSTGAAAANATPTPKPGGGRRKSLLRGERSGPGSAGGNVDDPMDIDEEQKPGQSVALDLSTAYAIPDQHQDVQEHEERNTASAHPDPLPEPEHPILVSLLRTSIPAPPSQSELEFLLSAPPLSYSAAAAQPSQSTIPPRKFCEMCGYWGQVRCTKCGVRVCGLECKEGHDETGCQRFWV
ncbi:MAG: hypothetical protein M1831_006547 [Alyxoria varia]|nr:MAG: hypothetical protein M1831_006547 [Alyxoria varia]